MIIRKDECRIKLNKRTFIRSSMLELSKVIIHYFHYKYINKNDDKADSLLYEIQTENVYENFYKDKDLFDFINYWKVSNYYDKTNSLLVGKMEGETYGMPVKSFVDLKAKIYTYAEDDHEYKKAKGIDENVDVEQKHFEFWMYNFFFRFENM